MICRLLYHLRESASHVKTASSPDPVTLGICDVITKFTNNMGFPLLPMNHKIPLTEGMRLPTANHM